jgi:hypothetical protein
MLSYLRRTNLDNTDAEQFLRKLIELLDHTVLSGTLLLQIQPQSTPSETELNEQAQIKDIMTVLCSAKNLSLSHQKKTADTNERKFIHDIASPIATALFLADSLQESMLQGAAPCASALEHVRLIYNTLDEIRIILALRREELIKQGVSSASTG